MLKNVLNQWQELRKKLPGGLTNDALYSSNVSGDNYNTKDVYSVKRVNPIYEDYEGSEFKGRKLCDNERQNYDKNPNSDKHPNFDERNISTTDLQSPKALYDITKPFAEARILPHFLNRKLSLPFPEDLQVDCNLLELSSSEFTTFETKASLRENTKDSVQESKPLSFQSEVDKRIKTTPRIEIENQVTDIDNVLTNSYSKEEIELLSNNKQDSPKTEQSQDEKDSNSFNVFDPQQQNLQRLHKRRAIYSRHFPNTLHKHPKTCPPLNNVSVNNDEKLVFIKDAKGITPETSNSGKRTRLYNNSISGFGKRQKYEGKYNKLKPQQKDRCPGVIFKSKPDTSKQYEETVCNYKYKKSTNKTNFLASKKFSPDIKTKLDTQNVYSRKRRSTNEKKLQVDERPEIDLVLNRNQSTFYEQENEWNKLTQNNEKLKQTANCLNRCPNYEIQYQKELSQPSSECSGLISLEGQMSTDSLDSESLCCNDEQHTRLDSSQEHNNFSHENSLHLHRLTAKCKSQRCSKRFCRTYDEYYKSVQNSTAHLCPDVNKNCDDCRRRLSNRLCRHRHNKRQLSLQTKQGHKVVKSLLKEIESTHRRGHHHLGIRHSPEGSPEDSGQEKINSNNNSNENLMSSSYQQLPYKRSSTLPWMSQSCSYSTCTCALNLDHQRRVEFVKNNPESHIKYVKPDDHRKNATRFGNLVNDETLMEPAKYSFSVKKDHALEISNENLKEYPKQRDGNSSEDFQSSPLPAGSLEGLIESYRWSSGRWEMFFRKQYFRKRRKQALFMVIMSISIILVLGITTGVILAYLRRKQSTTT